MLICKFITLLIQLVAAIAVFKVMYIITQKLVTALSAVILVEFTVVVDTATL